MNIDLTVSSGTVVEAPASTGETAVVLEDKSSEGRRRALMYPAPGLSSTSSRGVLGRSKWKAILNTLSCSGDEAV